MVSNPKYLSLTIAIGRKLPTQFKHKLVKFLKENIDIFYWKYSNMTGIPRMIKIGEENFVTEHKLNEDKKTIPVQQKKRSMDLERNTAAIKEVKELATAGILKETKYQTLLKNARATYQRLVDKVFENQIRRNMEAFVDYMVIKSMGEEDMLLDIQETFDKLRAINMKLNPKKCSFGVEEGLFLGHV
ncbi:hypothetical protein Tco_0529312 [Tanacetum coccineum]